MAHHNYQSTTFDKFTSQIHPDKDIPTILFAETNDELLISKFRNMPGFSVPIPYSYTDGRILGYIVTNTIIDINPDVTREEGVQSLTATPVRWIFILLIVIAGVSGGNTVIKRYNTVKNRIQPNQVKSSL